MEKIFQVCRVHWTDCVHIKGWHNKIELEAEILEGLPVMESVGWLLYRGEDFILLAQSTSENLAADMLKIPAAMVTAMWVLPGEEISSSLTPPSSSPPPQGGEEDAVDKSAKEG